MDIFLVFSAVFFSLSTFLVFYRKDKFTYQKISIFILSLLNGVVFVLASIELTFQGICLLATGIILAEFIVFETEKFAAATLISSHYFFVLMAIGILFETIIMAFSDKYDFDYILIGKLRLLIVFFMAFLIHIIYRKKAIGEMFDRLFKASYALEFLAVLSILINTANLAVYYFDQGSEYRFLVTLSLGVIFAFSWHYAHITSESETVELNNRILNRQLEKQAVAHDAYIKYIDDTGVFRHDLKNLSNEIKNQYKENKTVDGLEIINILNDKIDKIHVEKKLSNNHYVDAILKDAQVKCEANNIKFQAMFYLPEKLNLDQVKLIMVVSTLSDLGISSNLKTSLENRFFNMESIIKAGWVTIKYDFAYDGKSIDKDFKEDADNLSINQIQRSVERAEGILYFDADEVKRVVSISAHFHIEN